MTHRLPPRSARALAGLALAAAVLLSSLAPAGAAVRARDPEPDTEADLVGSFMFKRLSDFQSHKPRVYFDVVPTWGTVVAPSVTPHVGGVRAVSPTVLSFQAFLGFWRDCNRDGYIGDGASGLMVYRNTNQILPEAGLHPIDIEDVCPLQGHGSGPGSLRHNPNDGYIYEFLWIGPSTCALHVRHGALVTECPCPTAVCTHEVAEHSFFDDRGYTCDERTGRCSTTTHSRVWMDFGVPGEAVSPEPSAVPAPHGTFGSNGGMVEWADLLLGHRASRLVDGMKHEGLDAPAQALGLVRMPTRYQPIEPVWRDLNRPAQGALNDWESTRESADSLPYFEEWNVARLYNDAERFGEDGTSMKEVWDCESEGGTLGVLPGTHPEILSLPSNLLPPDGSLAPTVGHAARGLTGAVAPGGDSAACGEDPGLMPYPYLEEPEPTTSLKHRADVTFEFRPPRAINGVHNVARLVWENQNLLPDPTQSAYEEAGWVSREQFVGWPSPLGYGYTLPLVTTAYASVVNRVDLVSYLPNYKPGHVSAITFDYGAESCPGWERTPASLSKGWSCKPWEWPATSRWAPRVLDKYVLRDTDCYRPHLLQPALPGLGAWPVPAFPDPSDPQAPAVAPPEVTGVEDALRVGRCG